MLTFRENFPFARLASWRVGEDVVEFIKQVLHLASTLPLGHLVADAELWGPTVVSAALSKSCMIESLKTCDTAVLHGVVMSCGDIWMILVKTYRKSLGGFVPLSNRFCPEGSCESVV